VASWIDEEGTYASFIGSRSFCGEPVADIIARARNREGQPMGDALRAGEIAGEPLARMEADRYVAYLEPHIEQGGRLEASGKRIGVVTTIVGIVELRITFRGQQNHAGTTPMDIRRDAGAALIHFAALSFGHSLARRRFGILGASSFTQDQPASFQAWRTWSYNFGIPRQHVFAHWKKR
jgi:N-carbamoyl-L-amino-acid hydrolase